MIVLSLTAASDQDTNLTIVWASLHADYLLQVPYIMRVHTTACVCVRPPLWWQNPHKGGDIQNPFGNHVENSLQITLSEVLGTVYMYKNTICTV